MSDVVDVPSSIKLICVDLIVAIACGQCEDIAFICKFPARLWGLFQAFIDTVEVQVVRIHGCLFAHLGAILC